MRHGSLAVLALGLAVGCQRAAGSGGEKPEAGGAPGATPVRIASVVKATLSRVVAGPGHAVALAQQKVRAPFAGTLVELTVTDGDTVHAGQELGALVSRDSEAAVSGAKEMLREARTPAEQRDGERALALAQGSLVRAPLRSAWEGVVLSHGASAGDRVSEDQELLTVSAASSLVFQADVAQSDLALVHPGQPATITLVGRPRELAGLVHGVLSAANPGDLTVPVRVDLTPVPSGLTVGLFGSVRIKVGERRDVPALPPAAVLRDDVTGVSRVARVDPAGKVAWIVVTTGLADAGLVEIVTPELAAGETVVVSGQVGLPEGAPVSVQP